VVIGAQVEYQQSWGADRVARWAEAIQRRGGEVEAGYCARVTHVLCETQKHGVVMQVRYSTHLS
jgi:PAX-interacting protein 1